MNERFHISKRIEQRILEICAGETGPFYLYDTAIIRENCNRIISIPYPAKRVHFAMMANSNPTFIKIVKDAGLHIFVNSIMHLEIAEKIGYHDKEIIFAASALDEATMNRVKQSGAILIVDSLGQLKQWSSLFPDASVGIRCNIGELIVPKKTLAGYFLGKHSRLGLTPEVITRLKGNPHISGLHIYVGTNITDINYFIDCYSCLTELAGLFPGLRFLDFGGGFGIGKKAIETFDMKSFGLMVKKLMDRASRIAGREIKLILEPGRMIGVNAGYFVCRAVDIKEQDSKQLVGVNASSVQFPRPLFYPEEAFHPVKILRQNGQSDSEPWINSSIYGCSTYSRDFLARDITIPRTSKGDIIILGHAGAYCATAHSDFLGFPKAKEYFL
jgi:diaminopimelate decarboxylase